MNDLSGSTIKGYELQERIGSGRFGAVYRGVKSSIGREVAVKVILPQVANQPEFIQCFEKEARLVARLEHPHITPFYSYWRNTDEACIVTRLFRGGNLSFVLQSEPFSLERTALFLDQMAAALQVAHRNNIIHGALKPENILFDEDGNVYLADFGLTFVFNYKGLASAHSETTIEEIPDYLSPEQIRGESVTKMTDIYGLGLILYEVLTKAHPFPNKPKVEKLYQQLNNLLPPVSTLAPEIGKAVNAVIQKATAKNPALRYSNALELALAFREATQLSLPQTKDRAVETLTLREQEVLQRIIQGKSNQEIAQELYLAVNSVKWYNKEIYRKLRVRSRVQAIIRARELHLIERPDTGNTASTVIEPENPYKGLHAFQSGDSQYFFGRERLIQELLDRMAEVHSKHVEILSKPVIGKANLTRFLAIVGPSGGGKSSLVKSGLIPALWRGALLKPEHWFVAELVPGNRPLDSLEIALTKVAANFSANLHEQLQRDQYGLIRVAQLILPDDGSELVMVIDQFEEVFTSVRDEKVRTQFLEMLVAAVTDTRSRIRIVITMRADFYDRPLHYSEFGELVRSRMVTILPLSAEELEQAIVRPAKQVGVTFEAGLVASIIAEVNYQLGALPLLQFTLTELFERRAGCLLTHEAYETIGGVIGALAKQADLIYQELTEAEKEAARQMFLRLVMLGEGAEDTRRRVPRSELLSINANSDLMDDLIDMYVSYRLLSLDNDPATRIPTVEIAHEALIQAWEQFKEWLTESRADLRVQRQLMLATEEWMNTKRDPGFLASGAHLVQFEAIATKAQLALSENERAYLNASIDERTRRDNEREVEQKRLLRLQRAIIGVLLLFLLTVLVLFAFALISQNDAFDQTRIAFSRQLAAQALAESRNPIGNDEYAALLAIRALKNGYDPIADGTLVDAAFRLPLRAFVGHTDEVYGVVFSPDGKYVLTGSGDQTARLWDAATGQLIQTFSGNGGGVYAVAFSLDGKYILTGNGDHTAKLWDAVTNQELRTFTGHTDVVDSVAFSPDGKYVLTGSTDDATTRLWDTATAQQIRIITDGSVQGVAFSSDGKYLLVADQDNTATLREISTGQVVQTFRGHSNSIHTVAFSPDGKYVLTGSTDNTAKLWEVATGREVYTLLGHSSSVRAVAFSPDGKYIATGSSDHTIRLWDAATGQELHRFRAHLGRVWSVAFSPDGRTLVSASADHTVKLWNVITDDEMATFSGHQDEVYDVAFSPSGHEILTGSRDSTAGLWDVATRQEVHRLAGHQNVIFSVAFSPDGAYALTVSNDRTAKLWDVATGQEIRTFSGHTAEIIAVAYSPDGAYALTGSADNTAKLWDVNTGREVRTFSEHEVQIDGVNFSPDGTSLLTAADNGVVTLWKTASGQQVRTFTLENNSIFDADFSPDGKYILAGGNAGSVVLWEIATGQQVRSYNDSNYSVYNIAFSADGKYIAAGRADRTAIVWDAATGEIIRVLSGHRDAVWGVAFSPDGKFVLTGSLDHTANLWQIDYHDFVDSVCAQLTRDFTDQERKLVSITDQEPTCSQDSQRTESPSS